MNRRSYFLTERRKIICYYRCMDIRYLAGLVDGEGHITVFKSVNGRSEHHYRALIRVVQSENNGGEQLFDILRHTYGGTVCYKAKYRMYEWSIYGKQATALSTGEELPSR